MADEPVETNSLKRNQRENPLLESEEQFRLLVERVKDYAIFMLDPTGYVVTWNSGAERIKGYRAEEIIGRHFSCFYLPADVEAGKPEQGLKIAEREGSFEDEGWRIRKDGVRFWTNVVITALRDNSGNLRGFAKVSRDITERKRAEQALRLSEERFAKAFRASPDGIVISRVSDGRIIEVNDRWCSLFDYSRDDVIDRTAFELNLFANPADRQLLLNQLETRGFVRDLELALRRKSGKVRQMSVSSEMLVIAGEPCVLSLTRDITESKRFEEKLNQALAELTRSNTELEQFAYVASHDLQEPLRMVTSYTQLLARRYKDKLDADANEFIAFAVEGANRMKRLLDDLLTYSRVNTRRRPPQPTSSEMILAHTLANLEVAIAENQAVITYDPLPIVLGDETQLTQLFQNLIGNALKFRAEQPPEIHISAREAGNEWQFSVRDNGIGLDPKFADRIFVIFQRLQAPTEYAGTGIGLAICKRIVERHGGRIWVESQPGQGATFYFTLPKLQAKDEYSV